MLFNSFQFIFVFLPACFGVYFLLGRAQWYRAQPYWLIGCSFGFCAYEDFRFLMAILASISFNYAIAQVLAQSPAAAEKRRARILAFAIAVNLLGLGYFKYRNFFLESLNSVVHAHIPIVLLWLPLGISFFTFQQIAYLVTASYPESKKPSLARYVLHISFFPKLIAGPIVHVEEWLPQFEELKNRRFSLLHFIPGLMLFATGLFKKSFIADPVGGWVNTLFAFVDAGAKPYFLEAWSAALGYVVQLYFDFSGYSDMAIGIALMLNISFPLNFSSPYRSRSIIEFWQRWHMTLSNFVNDYAFTPLASVHPRSRRWQRFSVFIAMTCCGIWHGAGWTFVVFGMLHGFFVVVNHAWRQLSRSLPPVFRSLTGWIARPLTLVCVTGAFVVFRSESLASALVLLKGMSGMNGFTMPRELEQWLGFLSPLGFSFIGIFHGENKLVSSEVFLSLVPPLAAALLLPNIYQFLRLDRGSEDPAWWQWAPTPAWSVVFAVMTGLGLISLFSENRQFLYFQF